MSAAKNCRALAHEVKDYAGDPVAGRPVGAAPELDALWWAADGLERLSRSGTVPATACEHTLARMAEALDLVEAES